MRAFASPRCGLGSILVWCHLWVEFVVRSRLALRIFSPGSPGSLPPQKPTTANPNLTRIDDPHENQQRLIWFPLINFVIYLSQLCLKVLSVSKRSWHLADKTVKSSLVNVLSHKFNAEIVFILCFIYHSKMKSSCH